MWARSTSFSLIVSAGIVRANETTFLASLGSDVLHRMAQMVKRSET